MSGFFFILSLICMAGTVLTLFGGLFAMAGAGEFNKKHGNTMMRLRVGCQGLAVVFLILALAVH